MNPTGIGGELALPRLIQVLDTPHEMQAFRQHYQDYAHVLGDAEQQAAQIFLMPVLVLGGNDHLDISKLANTAQIPHHASDARTETLGKTLFGHAAGFQAAIQQSRDQGIGILAHPSQDVGGSQAEADLGLPGFQGLAAQASQQEGAGIADAFAIRLSRLFRQGRQPMFDSYRIIRCVFGKVVTRCYHGVSLGHGCGGGLVAPGGGASAVKA